MRELSVEDLLTIHALGIAEHGGGDPTVPPDAPGAMGSVLHSALYNDGLIGYAAGLLCYIARSQRFVDGNKRTAWGACVRALEINGYTLAVAAPDAAAFVLRVANENLSVTLVADQLAQWLIDLETWPEDFPTSFGIERPSQGDYETREPFED